MRIVAVKALKGFREGGHADAEQPLKAWIAEIDRAEWTSMVDIKARYAHASIAAAERVVFNIGGNKYRLAVKVWFPGRTVWIKFVGTHAESDNLDVQSLSEVMGHDEAKQGDEKSWAAELGLGGAHRQASSHPADDPPPSIWDRHLGRRARGRGRAAGDFSRAAINLPRAAGDLPRRDVAQPGAGFPAGEAARPHGFCLGLARAVCSNPQKIGILV